MQLSLSGPVSLEELSRALNALAANKAPRPDGVVTEFFKVMWPCIGQEYHTMLMGAIERGTLPEGMTEGLISLLHKGGGRTSLNN
jgi:hypothetical protein